MTRVLAFCILLSTWGLFSTPAHALDDHEIASLIQAGIHEDDIIRMLENQGSECNLANGSVQKLRQAGASDRLVDRLRVIIKKRSGL